MRTQIRTALMLCAALFALPASPAAQTRGDSPLPPPVGPPTVSPVQPPDADPPFEPVYVFRKPVVRIGQDYTLPSGEAVRDVTTIMGDATIEGRVEGDVVVVFGSARVAPTAAIEGSLVVVGGSATIESGATPVRDLLVIGGTLTAPAGVSASGEHVVIGNAGIGSALAGLTPWVLRGPLWGRLVVPDLRWVWVAVGTFFLIYLLLNAMFHAPVRACAEAIAAKPLSVFFMGLLVLVLSIPVLVILAASVIGLAVVPFALCALIIGGLIGKAGVGRAIGRSLVQESSPDSRRQSFRSLTLGLVVLTLAYMVPVLGFITWAMTGVLALGGAALTFRTAMRREHPARVRPAALSPAAEPPVDAASAYSAAPAVAYSGVAEAERAEGSPPHPDGPPDADMRPPLAGPPPGGDFSLYPRATFLDRVAAFVLDCILVAIVVQLFDLSRHDGGFPVSLLAYHVAFWAWKGTTLGGIVCGLRVVRVQGTELRFADALVRGLASVLSIGALGIGCLWMLQDAERQMWHDKIAGTLVVKVPRHLVLP